MTGASSGIGRAAAQALAGRGYAVWLTYANDEQGGQATVDSCAGAAELRLSRLDLRAPDDIAALVRELGAAWGSLHAVVNNGAVTTGGAGAQGIRAVANIAATVGGTGSTSTTGDDAIGVFAASIFSPATVTTGMVRTRGAASTGIVASSSQASASVAAPPPST